MGTLKMCNIDRGFGFIKDESRGPIYLCITALQGSDPDNLGLGKNECSQRSPPGLNSATARRNSTS
jgi:cold shock CspA family protein